MKLGLLAKLINPDAHLVMFVWVKPTYSGL